mgnify:CR=1 FL=1
MKILLISYGNIDYDGRLRGLISIFSKMGTVFPFTRGKAPMNNLGVVCNLSYIRFVRESLRYAESLGGFDCLVLDNRKATIPGLLILRKIKPQIVIQDCRELYLMNEINYWQGKVGCFFEKCMLKKADIIICANKDRAKIMAQEYKLQELPLVYENLRELKYESDEELNEAKQKLDPLLSSEYINIISSSGCSLERTNDILVENILKVKRKCKLFLVGDSTARDEKVIRDIIVKNSIHNVEILGKLNQTELKYLISQCHIGIVNYGQYDTNNRLCASGKLYEFIYEGIPVVTTSNPPLKRLCDSEKIGCADDSYAEGINTVLEHYSEYKKNVFEFARNHTIQSNDDCLVNQIEERIKRCSYVEV